MGLGAVFSNSAIDMPFRLIDPGEDQRRSIRFMDAEILIDSPDERFGDYWELCIFVSQAVVLTNAKKSGLQ